MSTDMSNETPSQPPSQRKLPKWITMKEDIVISGISGIFPDSFDMNELAKNLYDGKNCVTGSYRRWLPGYLGLPKMNGTVPSELNTFDSEYFGYNDSEEVDSIDFQIRFLLEKAHEAFMDAGVNPELLRESNVGYFLATSVDETNLLFMNIARKVGSIQLHVARHQSAYNFHGPVSSVDVACASSLTALDQAMISMRTGECDIAIVAATNICIYPGTAMMFHDLSMTTLDCKCKPFDELADGYARSEASGVILLQKKSSAKRVYCAVRHTKTNADGYKPEGITFPRSETQTRLIRETYDEVGIDPLSVQYIESHATGTKVGDPVECKAMADSLCIRGDQRRNGPLLVGAMKSNIGHAEASSGLAAIAKVIISYENKCIPKNLHIYNLNPDIPELHNGLLKPLIENTPFEGGCISLNNFGFGGANAHAIFESDYKEVTDESFLIANIIPRLVLMCGRTQEAVKHIFDYIKSNRKQITREFLALFNEISRQNLKQMPFRGFMIMHEDVKIEPMINIEKVNDKRRPLYYVFSGLGSQWPAMGKALLKCDIFAKTIHHLSDVLKDYKVDLINLLTSDDKTLLSKPINCFVSIAAIQIAFVDILRELGITGDGFIGHSIGEMGCAYADGTLSAQQTIICAYLRGKCVEENVTMNGLMVAVGLSWDEVKKICPTGVHLACNNSADSVTIAGPYLQTNQLIRKFREDNIFAKKVESCGIAFHTPEVSKMESSLTRALKTIGVTTKNRSPKWISTSAEDTSTSDASYYANNLIKPVKFFEAVQRIPKNAVVLEVSPHSLFSAAILGTIGLNGNYIFMMKRNGNVLNILQVIGQLYQLGYEPLIEKLYPIVQWPVPRGTPFISPLIKWNHTKKFEISDYEEFCAEGEKIRKTFKVKLRDRENESLADHVIEGRILYPATGYLMLAWKTLANNLKVKYEDLPIQFENVQLKRATILPKNQVVTFDVYYFEHSGNFEIVESGQVCVSGNVSSPQPTNGNTILQFEHIYKEISASDKSHKLVLNGSDIYKEFRLRGYDYGPKFQGIKRASSDGQLSTVKWAGDWIAFADSLLQIGLLTKENRFNALPTTIELLRCDPNILKVADNEEREIDAAYDFKTNIGYAPGIEMRGMKTTISSRKLPSDVLLHDYVFIPHHEECAIDDKTKAELQEYVTACETVANHIAYKLDLEVKPTTTKSVCVKKFLSSKDTKHTLIKVLDQIKNNDGLSKQSYWPTVEKLLEDNFIELTEDLIINGTHFCNRFVQPLVDTAFDNYKSRPFNFLEINSGGAIMVEYLSYLVSLDDANTKYKSTIAHPNKEQISSNNDGVVLDFNRKTFKIGEIGDEVKPSSNGLIVYRDASACNIGQDLVDLRLALNSMYAALDENGFLMAFLKYKELPFEHLITRNIVNYKTRTAEFVSKALEKGLLLVNTKYDSIQTLALLFRKPSSTPVIARHIIQVYSNNFNWVNEYKKVRENNSDVQQVWLVTNEKHSGILGSTNCLRKEPFGDLVRCVLSEQIHGKNIPNEILALDLQQNIYRNGVWGQLRNVQIESQSMPLREAKHAYINVQTKGDLSSFAWFEASHKYWPLTRKSPQESLINVHYASLNFRDIMCATGRLSADSIPGGLNLEDGILGLEFSGVDVNGNKVMGMIAGRGLATTVVAPDPEFMWPVPENWSLEEASTVPCVYATSYYALKIRAKLQNNEKVLIHAGSGGVGIAAISICLSMNCEVFTTVGSLEKREFMLKQFPQLSEDHILNSRDNKFEPRIRQLTNGRGVDVIINSLSEEKLLASVRSLAPNGRFCEIGKFDLSMNNPLDLSHLIQNKTFHGVLLDAFFDFEKLPPQLRAQKKKLQQMISEGIKAGVVKPLPRTIFDKNQVEEAFRFMSTGKHIGKVMLKIREDNSSEDQDQNVMSIPRTALHPQKSFIITGGLGGFGLEIAQWLAERGARKLVLTSRNGPREQYHHYIIKRLQKMGVEVKIWTGHGYTEEEVRAVLNTASKMGPIGGIFHLAMQILDALMENQNIENFERSANTKILQCNLYDKLSRTLCPQLEYFVVFSSIVATKGNVGQTNYGFGNSSCERIIETRRSDGLPGLAIQWGAIGDVGFVAEQMKTDNIAGSAIQRMPSCLAVFDRFLQSDYVVVGSRIRYEDKTRVSNSSDNLISQIGHIMGVADINKLDSKTRLIELGIDSLMGVEIRLVLERDYNINISNKEISSLTIDDLLKLQSTAKTPAKAKADDKDEDTASEENIPVEEFLVPTEYYTRLNYARGGKPVFLLPSAEEQFYFLEPLANKIMRPVYGINWTEEFNKMTSLEAIAKKMLKTLESLSPNESHDLIGYSFGGVMAIEIISQIQKIGNKVGNVILLESSPQLVREQSRQVLNGTNENEANVNTLLHIVSKLVNIDEEKVRHELSSISTREDRIKVIIKKLRNAGINVSEKKLITLIEAFLVKINLAYNYTIAEKYKGNVTLIKADGTNFIKSDSDVLNKHDYGLSEVIKGECNVITYSGDHKSFIKNNLDQMATYINNIK